MNFHIYQTRNYSADNNQLESAIHENKIIHKHFFYIYDKFQRLCGSIYSVQMWHPKIGSSGVT